MSSSILPMFSSKNFIVSGCTFRSLMHFIFVYGVRRRRQWDPTPVFLPGKFHGQRRLVGYSSWGHEESHTTGDFTFTFMHWRRKWQPTPVFLPGEFQGRRSLVGCHLWGRAESDTTEATQQHQKHGVKKCSNFILLHVAIQFSHFHLLKRLSLPHCIFLSLLS